MYEPTLLSLAVVAARKQTSPALFVQLCQQLNGTHPISAADYTVLLTTRAGDETLRARYVVALALHSYSSCGNLLDLLRGLASMEPAAQATVRAVLLPHLASAGLGTAYAVADFLAALTAYLEALPAAADVSSFLVTVHAALAATEAAQSAPEYAAFLAAANRGNPSGNPHVSSHGNSSGNSLGNSNGTSHVSSHVSSHGVGSAGSTKARRLLWLSPVVQAHETSSPPFLAAFETALGVKAAALLPELVLAAFDGYAIARAGGGGASAPQGAERTWRLFLTKKLPTLVRDLGVNGVDAALLTTIAALDAKVARVVRSATDNDDFMSLNTDDSLLDEEEFGAAGRDVRHEFLEGCASLGVVARGAFARAARAGDLALSDAAWARVAEAPVDFGAALARALDANAELVSLEALGLMAAMRALVGAPLASQIRGAAAVRAALSETGVRLRRVCLALVTLPDALDLVVALLSPRAVTDPLTAALDAWGADADTFQETYTDFGCVVLLVAVAAKRYAMDPAALGAFAGAYVSDWGAAPTAVDVPAVPAVPAGTDAVENSLLLAWLTALFQSGAISDELMAQTSAPQCYALTPLVFRHAVFACARGAIDADALRSGLEYFLQPFLLVCTIGIFEALGRALWAEGADRALLLLALEMLTNADLAGEAQLIRAAVMRLVAPSVARAPAARAAVARLAPLAPAPKLAAAPARRLAAEFALLLSWCLTNHALPTYAPVASAALAASAGHEAVLWVLLQQLEQAGDAAKPLAVAVDVAVGYVVGGGAVGVSRDRKDAWVRAVAGAPVAAPDAALAAFVSFRAQVLRRGAAAALFLDALANAVHATVPLA